MFKHAIVRKPGRSVAEGISQTPELGKPDYDLALKQHDRYVELLEQCGLEVTTLEANEAYPDSCFIEDNALCTEQFAILSRPGALTRREEAKLPDLRQALLKFYPADKIYEIADPGLVDPGDILMIGNHFYIGLSNRTNQAAAEQIAKILDDHGYTSETVPVKGVLHLKDDVVYLAGNDIIVAKIMENHPQFAQYNQIVADDDDYYAVNSLWLNGKVLVPTGHPKIEQKIREAGYEVLLIDMSEYEKITGSLTCLSLRLSL